MAFRVDNASSSAAYAPGARAAGPNPGNYFVDPSGPTPGTIWDADFANMLQEEIAGAVEAAGLTLSKTNDSQLSTAIGGGAAVSSHATTTGSVTTNHAHAVIASTTSTASGGAQHSAVVCGTSSVASGSMAVCISGGGNTASGAYSGTYSSSDCVVSAEGAAVIGCADVDVASITGVAAGCLDSFLTGGEVMVASRNAEFVNSYAIGGGYSGAGISKTSANQNMSWMIESNGGIGHFEGSVEIGGTVDNVGGAGQVPTITLTGSSGDIDCDGDLNVGTNADVTGTLDVTGRTTVAKFEVGATYLFRSTADHTGGSPLGAGAWDSITVAGLPVDLGSQIRFVMGSVDAVTCEVVMGSVSLNGTTATIRYWNEGSSGAYNNYLYFDVFVINPS